MWCKINTLSLCPALVIKQVDTHLVHLFVSPFSDMWHLCVTINNKKMAKPNETSLFRLLFWHGNVIIQNHLHLNSNSDSDPQKDKIHINEYSLVRFLQRFKKWGRLSRSWYSWGRFRNKYKSKKYVKICYGSKCHCEVASYPPPHPGLDEKEGVGGARYWNPSPRGGITDPLLRLLLCFSDEKSEGGRGSPLSWGLDTFPYNPEHPAWTNPTGVEPPGASDPRQLPCRAWAGGHSLMGTSALREARGAPKKNTQSTKISGYERGAEIKLNSQKRQVRF